jgi:hypothetical protein
VRVFFAILGGCITGVATLPLDTPHWIAALVGLAMIEGAAMARGKHSALTRGAMGS